MKRYVVGIVFVIVFGGFFLLWPRPINESADTGKLREFTEATRSPEGVVAKRDEGHRIPTDLDDALVELERILAPEVIEEIRALEDGEAGKLHLGLGMWLRHNWELWDWGDGTQSPLRDWFNEREVYCGDAMSSVILDSFLLRLHGKPARVEEQLRTIREANEKRRGPPVRFPRTGTIGPDTDGLRTKDRRVTTTVDAEGDLFFRTVALPADPREELFKHAETKRDLEHPEQPSLIHVLIRADRDAPWSAVRALLGACADPAVRIYKVQFAVASESDGEPGTLAAFQPIAFAPVGHVRHRTRELPGQARALVKPDNGSAPALDGLFGALSDLDPAWRSVPALLRPGDDIDTETVLRAFDLLLRAGARWVLFGPQPDEDAPDGVTLNGAPCGRDAGGRTPPPLSRSETMAGVVEPPPLYSTEDEDE